MPADSGLVRVSVVLACLLVCGAPRGSAQTSTAAPEEREVIAAVQAVFDAMAACDAATIRARTLPEGRLFRLVAGSDQPPRATSLEQFASQFETCARKPLERMWAPQVRVHKGIATVWAPYDFWLDGQFSHCGIDSFELVATSGGWKLAGGTYTVEKSGCAPSPLGPPR